MDVTWFLTALKEKKESRQIADFFSVFFISTGWLSMFRRGTFYNIRAASLSLSTSRVMSLLSFSFFFVFFWLLLSIHFARTYGSRESLKSPQKERSSLWWTTTTAASTNGTSTGRSNRQLDDPERKQTKNQEKKKKENTKRLNNNASPAISYMPLELNNERQRQWQEHKNAEKRLLKIFSGVIFTKLFFSRFYLSIRSRSFKFHRSGLPPPFTASNFFLSSSFFFFFLRSRQLSWDD